VGDGDQNYRDAELRPVAASTSNAVERGRAEGAVHPLTKPSAYAVGLLSGGWVNYLGFGGEPKFGCGRWGRPLSSAPVLGFGG
jgi:hypothetical protein